MENKEIKRVIVYPNSAYDDKLERIQTEILKEAYCPKGHNLVSGEVSFAGNSSIWLKVKNNKNTGNLFLSPVLGEKCKVSFEDWYRNGEIYEYTCPECDVKLNSVSPCSCGGELVALYLDPKLRISDSVTFCTRFGCFHSEIESINMLKSIHL